MTKPNEGKSSLNFDTDIDGITKTSRQNSGVKERIPLGGTRNLRKIFSCGTHQQNFSYYNPLQSRKPVGEPDIVVQML